MSGRIYTTLTTELHEALDATDAAHLIEGKATQSKKLQAWALYGYRRWREDADREQKIAAYEALGADDEHLETVRASALRAAEAGVL